jgi:hypothetical protein
MSAGPLPVIVAEITFLRPEEGGRSLPPGPSFPPSYRAHLVAEPRVPGPSECGADDDLYLGVVFLRGPSRYVAGRPGRFVLACVYPEVSYDALQPGAAFAVREGPHTVGFGRVVSREVPGGAARAGGGRRD